MPLFMGYCWGTKRGAHIVVSCYSITNNLNISPFACPTVINFRERVAAESRPRLSQPTNLAANHSILRSWLLRKHSTSSLESDGPSQAPPPKYGWISYYIIVNMHCKNRNGKSRLFESVCMCLYSVPRLPKSVFYMIRHSKEKSKWISY